MNELTLNELLYFSFIPTCSILDFMNLVEI